MPSFRRSYGLYAAVALSLFTVGICSQATSQDVTPQNCHPVSGRTQELGCWIIADQTLGPLTTSQAFWHLDTYPTREAAMAAKGSRGTVVTALGKIWLLSIEESAWQAPAGGEHVATIGPLPIDTAKKYSAQYMEAVFTPGMVSAIHDHPGPEAFYTISGQICLETPQGASIGQAGTPVVVAGGLPMQLVATGTDKRQSVVLVLYDSSDTAGHPVHDWTPKGLCKK
jgi:quercetin dioxygenase-like cupin family protein